MWVEKEDFALDCGRAASLCCFPAVWMLKASAASAPVTNLKIWLLFPPNVPKVVLVAETQAVRPCGARLHANPPPPLGPRAPAQLLQDTRELADAEVHPLNYS